MDSQKVATIIPIYFPLSPLILHLIPKILQYFEFTYLFYIIMPTKKDSLRIINKAPILFDWCFTLKTNYYTFILIGGLCLLLAAIWF